MLLWMDHPFKIIVLAVGKVHIPVPSFSPGELASTYDFQNHQYYCRGVAKMEFCEKVKNRNFVMMAIYAQHSLNMAFQKCM